MIILIIDNKERDLPSVIKLAEKILESYDQRVIVTNYHELDDIFALEKNKISLVLFSYCKKDSKTRILFAKKSKYKIAVYDQEGANGFDCLGLVNVWKKNRKLIKLVDSYNFWGDVQKKECLKIVGKNKPKRNNVIGYIRNEINIKEKREFLKGKYVLITTNFALIDPRYNSPKKEIETVKRTNLYQNKTYKFLGEMRKRKNMLIDTLNKLAINNKNINFLIKVHPFEEKDEWSRLSSNNKNVSIAKDKNALNLIKNSKCLVHLDSITSLEANYQNVPAISVSYLIREKKLSYKILANSSDYKASSYKDLEKKIKKFYFSKIKKKIRVNNNLKKYFGNLDGNRTNQLAKELIFNSKIKIKDDIKINFDTRPIRTNIKILLRRNLNKNVFFIIYFLIVGKKKAIKYRNKQFNKSLIKNYLSKNFKCLDYYANSYEITK